MRHEQPVDVARECLWTPPVALRRGYDRSLKRARGRPRSFLSSPHCERAVAEAGATPGSEYFVEFSFRSAPAVVVVGKVLASIKVRCEGKPIVEGCWWTI